MRVAALRDMLKGTSCMFKLNIFNSLCNDPNSYNRNTRKKKARNTKVYSTPAVLELLNSSSQYSTRVLASKALKLFYFFPSYLK